MDANIATPAALIGDPVRAAMLMALADGRAQPAGALAWAAGVSAQTASNHLAKLIGGGLLSVETEGRHRYYRLANPEVGDALEALARLAAPVRSLEQPRSPQARALRHARACYGHLAGQLGVALAQALEAQDLLRPTGPKAYAVTPAGLAWFAALGVEVGGGAGGGARRCLDWTERRHHLAGPVGVKLMARLVALGWIEHDKTSRAVRLTVAGAAGLRERLGLELSGLEAARAA
jgi:DNA-binding transcriptional ArsR family regulator